MFDRDSRFSARRRAVLIPATTVPVTIIGAFAAMACDRVFTINIRSNVVRPVVPLLIGIVVDYFDCDRRECRTSYRSRKLPQREVFNQTIHCGSHAGPVIGITLVLMVDLSTELAFLSGITG